MCKTWYLSTWRFIECHCRFALPRRNPNSRDYVPSMLWCLATFDSWNKTWKNVMIHFCSRMHAPLNACCRTQSEVFLKFLKSIAAWERKKGPSENLLDLVMIWFTMVGWFHLMNIKWENQNSTFQLNGDQPVSASQVASENLQSALQQTWAMEPWAQRVDGTASFDCWLLSSF